MRVLMTGHDGYIGSVMMPYLQRAGHDVTGMDSFLYAACTLGEPRTCPPEACMDIRDAQEQHLAGFDAVIHLAALSNDPVGDLDPATTYDINHRGSVALAVAARRAGVSRFLFASSCSLYGVAGDELLAEDAAFNPITPYGESKVLVERDLARQADAGFSPTSLRNATAYGFSPRFRADIVVNNLVGHAYTTGEVLIKSDGSPWRPLVHVGDICLAFQAVLEAPRELVHNQSFNVGRTEENYRIRDLADMVREVVPGSRVRYAEGGGPDPRCYRVDCGKIARSLPAFRPVWTVRQGMEELHEQFRSHRLTAEEFLGPRFTRVKEIGRLRNEGRLDARLRWTADGAWRIPA